MVLYAFIFKQEKEKVSYAQMRVRGWIFSLKRLMIPPTKLDFIDSTLLVVLLCWKSGNDILKEYKVTNLMR
jgi:hypothetical protein